MAEAGAAKAGAASPSFDLDAFARRLKALYAAWENPASASAWHGARALAVASPPPSEDMRYLKSTTLQIWLLGYEFPETIMLFVRGALHVVCSAKKAQHLAGVQAACEARTGVKMVVHPKPKGDDGTAAMRAALAAAREAGSEGGAESKIPFGVLSREAPEGAVMEKWAQLCAEEEWLEAVDVAAALGDVFAVKEDSEIMNIRKAGFLGAKVLKEFVVPKLEEAIDEEKQVSHEKLMEQTEEVITEPSKVKIKLKAENCDICYPPVFQSGGQFDLKPSAMSNEENLCYSSGGVILCSIGARYDSYCSNLSRSYIIDPSPPQEKAYKTLLKAHEAAIAAIRPGQRMCDVFRAATAVFEADAPELVPHLTRNAGSGIGVEFRESSLALSGKNEKVILEGMAFNVALGLQGLRNEASTDPKTQDYALLIADTVVVKRTAPGADKPEKPVEVATALCSKGTADVFYSLKDDDDEDEDEGQEEQQRKPMPNLHAGPRGTRSRDSSILNSHLRSEAQDMSKEQQRQRHQQELAKQKLEETARRVAAGGLDKVQAEGPKRSAGEMIAYRTMDEIPMPPRDLKIQIDQRHEAVLLPIYGLMVPFHISLIKTVSAQPDAGQTYIRIVLNVPGAGFAASDYPMQHFPDSVYVKEISFRSTDARHASEVVQLMKTMSKQFKQRESERAERATLVAQEKLQLAKGPLPRNLRLPDLWIRPGFATKGRKMTGVLEAHVNGFKYSTNRPDERLDVMYANIKHAIFQPAENEMITLLHFHLHNPIMVGKKKTKDVQFYAEVMDVSQAVGGARRSAYDPDEIEEEQRERERRNKINKEFENFVHGVQTQWEKDPNFSKLELEFDVPFRELGFHGVPHKSSAFLVPSVNCLVELIEQPFFVVTLNEVEIVNLERVGQGQKTFDMAIVFKDFRRDVVRIDAIPSTSLDPVKTWLNQMNIKYYESKLNLNWKPILQNIIQNPSDFVREGGWEFLNLEATDSEGESEEEDAYEPSDVDEVSEEEEEGEEDDESVVDSEEEEEEDEEEEEEGLTWDELEEKARREDKELGEESDSEEERRKRKHKSSGGGSAAKPGAPKPGMARPGGAMGSGRPGGGSFSGGKPWPSGGASGQANRPRPPMGGGPPKRPKY